MITLNKFPGRAFTSRKAEYLYFGGTAYLGLQTYKPFQKLLIRNLKKYGSNYSSSRISNVQLDVYAKAESYLSKQTGCESSVCLTSGFIASQLTSLAFNGPGYKKFYAPDTHASLHTATIDNEFTYEALHNNIKAHLRKNTKQIPVLFMDTVNFNGLHYPNFNWLGQLPLNDIIIVADDSHGFGVVGNGGSGCYENLVSFEAKELIVCGSLGKGFGIQAGTILGKKDIIKKIKNTSFYGSAGPPAPLYMSTLIEAENIYRKRLLKLRRNINLFFDLVHHKQRFNYMSGHPVFSYSDPRLTKHLEKNKIIGTSFHYPNSNGSLISKIVLSAHHKKKDIELLAKHINTLS